MNIENKVAILENTIALLKRKGAVDLNTETDNIEIGFGSGDSDGDVLFGIKYNAGKQEKVIYDRRTYGFPVVAFGLNNTLIEGQAELQEFEFDLDKSKFRTDLLVFPVHLDFGPSKFVQNDDNIRYSLDNQFRFGIGGYAGFNLGSRQKLKYEINGESVKDKLKRDYNTGSFVYGLSAYAGFDSILLYAKYNLNPIFQDAAVEQHTISLGLRFDLD
ncbi:MAG TPA: hypothetical protein VFM69_03330 [Pricia sp.]|nr:hypothetical protein [Pricia sp.]